MNQWKAILDVGHLTVSAVLNAYQGSCCLTYLLLSSSKTNKSTEYIYQVLQIHISLCSRFTVRVIENIFSVLIIVRELLIILTDGVIADVNTMYNHR